MHILLLSATETEIKPTLDYHQSGIFKTHGHRLDILIGGIGMLATSYALTHSILLHRPNYILQAGIGGSFSESLPPGRVVMVKSESLADMGVNENDVFNDVFDMKLADRHAFPFENAQLANPYWHEWSQHGIPFVNGVTVNTITTGIEKIKMIKEKYQPDVESMEGAALHFVALKEKIPFIQLRAISNFVGERDKKNWKITEAIERLNNSVIQLIRDLP